MVTPAFWRGRRVFLTGHTGFKGGWLSLWLNQLGADIYGFSLPPDKSPSLYDVANIECLTTSILADIRDADALSAAMTACAPSVVFHLAAQPLVRTSYLQPMATFSTNVMGTVYLLEAARHCPGIDAIVVITSDKCYENHQGSQHYQESDALGGHDPYSSSKACAELVASSYRRSFPEVCATLATARAGNVIGGGDWAIDRLVPDLLCAFSEQRSLAIRHPDAVRPWQHVLEPLAGYLKLAECLVQKKADAASAWNFGPTDDSHRSVSWLANTLCQQWGEPARWHYDHSPKPHEAQDLRLDSRKARAGLGWMPRWNLEQALSATLDWYRAWERGRDMQSFTIDQIAAYSGR